jgi:ketosteroid isomerase-like protein
MSFPDPSSPLEPNADRDAVLAANDAFYEAFEARDLDAMSDLWAHDDRVICVHPGWTELRGWASVASSWAALFGGPQYLQFIVTDPHVVLAGDVAWVSCDENLLAGEGSATVASLNLFARDDAGSWKMLAHHGAPVMSGPADLDDDEA